MPILIKKIQGEILTNIIDNVCYVSSVSGEIQREDYINLNGFTAYLQNLSRAEETAALIIPTLFGLTNQFNTKINTLEINY